MVLARKPQLPPSTRREPAPAQQQQQQRQTAALVQALGEFAVFVTRVKRSQKKKRRSSAAVSASTAACAVEEKRAVLEWLRSLSPVECSSLCAITDVGFVKTLLSMAMVSKQKRATGGGGVHIGSHIDEFQLLPVTSKSLALSIADAKTWLKGDNSVAAASTSPR